MYFQDLMYNRNYEFYATNGYYVRLHINANPTLKREAAKTWVDINVENNRRRVERV